jgi:hypothetical protein
VSYCRPSAGHDAYVVHLVQGTLSCIGCLLAGGGLVETSGQDFNTRSRKKMIAHLLEHRAKGHRLGHAIARLRRELKSPLKGDKVRPVDTTMLAMAEEERAKERAKELAQDIALKRQRKAVRAAARDRAEERAVKTLVALSKVWPKALFLCVVTNTLTVKRGSIETPDVATVPTVATIKIPATACA